jgi:hypothetical protein
MEACSLPSRTARLDAYRYRRIMTSRLADLAADPACRIGLMIGTRRDLYRPMMDRHWVAVLAPTTARPCPGTVPARQIPLPHHRPGPAPPDPRTPARLPDPAGHIGRNPIRAVRRWSILRTRTTCTCTDFRGAGRGSVPHSAPMMSSTVTTLSARGNSSPGKPPLLDPLDRELLAVARPRLKRPRAHRTALPGRRPFRRNRYLAPAEAAQGGQHSPRGAPRRRGASRRNRQRRARAAAQTQDRHRAGREARERLACWTP